MQILFWGNYPREQKWGIRRRQQRGAKANIRVHSVHPLLWANEAQSQYLLRSREAADIEEEHLSISSDFYQLRVASRVVHFFTLSGCTSNSKGIRKAPRIGSPGEGLSGFTCMNLVTSAMTGVSRAPKVSSSSLLQDKYGQSALSLVY